MAVRDAWDEWGVLGVVGAELLATERAGGLVTLRLNPLWVGDSSLWGLLDPLRCRGGLKQASGDGFCARGAAGGCRDALWWAWELLDLLRSGAATAVGSWADLLSRPPTLAAEKLAEKLAEDEADLREICGLDGSELSAWVPGRGKDSPGEDRDLADWLGVNSWNAAGGVGCSKRGCLLAA